MGAADSDDVTASGFKKRRPYRRDEILAAAVQLFELKGYHGTGMDDIGAIAGMSGPAIYRHFRSKEDLLETLLLESATAFVDRSRAISAANPDAGRAISALVDDYVEALLDNPSIAAVAAYESRNLRAEVHAALVRAEGANVDEWLAALGTLQPERPTPELRASIRGVMAMAVSIAASRRGPARAGKSALVKRLILGALEVRGAAIDNVR
jgi:AcrR family transcriptional regulator